MLRPKRYATFIVRDAYQDGRYRFTGADLAARAERVGFVTKGDLVWYQAGARLRPYGYPRAFVPNIVHQHILVLPFAPSRSLPHARHPSRRRWPSRRARSRHRGSPGRLRVSRRAAVNSGWWLTAGAESMPMIG